MPFVIVESQIRRVAMSLCQARRKHAAIKMHTIWKKGNHKCSAASLLSCSVLHKQWRLWVLRAFIIPKYDGAFGHFQKLWKIENFGNHLLQRMPSFWALCDIHQCSGTQVAGWESWSMQKNMFRRCSYYANNGKRNAQGFVYFDGNLWTCWTSLNKYLRSLQAFLLSANNCVSAYLDHRDKNSCFLHTSTQLRCGNRNRTNSENLLKQWMDGLRQNKNRARTKFIRVFKNL